MRRSQRLMKNNAAKDKLSMDNNIPLPENRNNKPENQKQEKEIVENGSNKTETVLTHLTKEASEDQSTVVVNNTRQDGPKKGNERKVFHNVNDLISIQPQTQGCPTPRSSTTTTARRGRKRGAIQTRNRQQCKRSRLASTTNNVEIKPPIIPVDNYLNPLRNVMLQPGPNLQNNGFSYYNNNIPRMNLNNNSLLPPVYPTHFADQNYTVTSGFNYPQQLPTVPTWNTIAQPDIHFPTPELSEPLDYESSTSTLSLPESLREVFGCDDIRDVLKLDKVVYRMRSLHLQTLAFVLNVEYDYLHDLIEKIMKLDTETLKKVAFAFQPEEDKEKQFDNKESTA